MERHIVHLNIPDFYASLEQLRHPELEKHPLALAESISRAVVQGVNRAARSEGIQEGITIGQARRLCRRLHIVPPDFHFYRHQHQIILQELDLFSPLVEGAVLGHYFVDLTGTRRLWGPFPDTACRLESQLATRRQLHAQVGLGRSKLISEVAAHCVHPGDLGCVFPGWENSFLAPLPVEILPGIGAKTIALLSDLNIQTIRQLTAISPQMLTTVLGKAGLHLYKLAQGMDLSPIIPFHKAPRLSSMYHLGRDEIDRDRLMALLLHQTEETAWVLRRHNRFPGKVELEIRYADGITVRRGERLVSKTHCLDRYFFDVIRQVFKRLFQRRVALRRLTLELSEFSMPFRQMSLFPGEENAIQREESLQKALDSIRLRYGRRIISWGRTLEVLPPDNKVEGISGEVSPTFQWLF